MRVMILVAALALVACSSDEPRGDPVSGEVIAQEVEPSCGLCHTLEGAEFVGQSAPNLDDLRPGYQRVLDAVRTGPGLMPSYSGVLTDDAMHDLAAFISREAGS